MKIAINGAGIAGTPLAWWLRRFGHEPVLFEEAPGPRTGRYVIDFWGVGYDAAEKMGLVPTLHERGYRVGEWRLVDADGRRTGGFSTQSVEHLTNGRVGLVAIAGLVFAVARAMKQLGHFMSFLLRAEKRPRVELCAW